MTDQTPSLLDKIEAQRSHHHREWNSTSDEVWRPNSAYCAACGVAWPCDAVAPLDALLRVKALIEDLAAVRGTSADTVSRAFAEEIRSAVEGTGRHAPAQDHNRAECV